MKNAKKIIRHSLIFCIILLLLFSSFDVSADTNTFGNTTAYITGTAIEGVVAGVNASMSGKDPGRVDYAMVSLDKSSSAGQTWYVKCSLYWQSNNTYLATSENRSIKPTTSFLWYKFNFSTRPTVQQGVVYRIYVWANNSLTGTLQVSSTTGASSYQKITKTQAFTDNWPSKLNGLTYATGAVSIYCSYTFFVATALVNPKNQTTNVNRQPLCNIWANGSRGGKIITVNFYENSSGRWVRSQTNTKVSENSSVTWNYTNANSFNKRYWWKTTIDDGTTNISRVYYFTTNNRAPTTYLISPKNQTTGISLQPMCKVNANDSDGGTLTINFYENSTGSYVRRQTNSSATANSTVQWNFSQGGAFNKRYWWIVTIYDGTTNVSKMYYFNTKGTPTTYLITPQNQSTNINRQPVCKIWANASQQVSRTVNFYENSSGSYTRRQTNASITTNSTVTWNFSQANSFNKRYWWIVTIYDGTTNLSSTYYFNTKSIPIIYLIFPKNQTTNVNQQPLCRVWANKTTGGTLTINFYENTSGAYVRRQTNSSAANMTIYWNYTNVNSFNNQYWWIVTIYDGTTNLSSTYYFNTKTATYTVRWDNTYVLVGGATNQTIKQLWKSNLTVKAFTIKYGGTIWDIVQDATYIYCGGATTQKIYQFWRSNLTKKAQSADYGGSIYCLTQDDTYIYCAGANAMSNQTIWQCWKSNLTRRRYSAAYGTGTIQRMAQDTNYIYAVGAGGVTTAKLNQYWKSNLTLKAQSSAYGGSIWALAIDSTYAWIGGATNQLVKQYWLSNLTLKRSSANYTGTIYYILQDPTYIYAAGGTTHKVNQYWKTNLTLKQQSADYGGNIEHLTQDLTYVYAGGITTNKVYQYWKSNMTKKQESASYGGLVYALAFDDITINNLPGLSLASVYPTTGVASYTTFRFNVTWTDIDGDTPASGYLTVNISCTGWYVNVSMTWVSGSNTTGAKYTYSTKLIAGSYSYQFWAYDGKDHNHTTSYSNPTVSSQSYSISVTQSDSMLWFNMTSLGTYGTQANVAASGQSSGTPALAILNQGNVPINLTIRINVSVGAGLSLKWDVDNDPAGATVITTSDNSIQVNLAVGTTKNIWMWMDFTNAGPGSGTRTVTITSNSGSW